MRRFDLDVLVTRGPAVEARHQVHAAVVGPDDALLALAGDPEVISPWRSCAKPLQVHPFVADGHLDATGWGQRELALACASHGGEPEHVALAEAMLDSIGLQESSLACGPHLPLAERGARWLAEHGTSATRLHNNCSGKHAAMLAAARQCGLPTEGYERPDHPLQVRIRQRLARWTGLDNGALDVGTDGCGVPVFILTLRQMARAYAALADAARNESASARILDAMATYPDLVGGTDRFDTVLMRATGGSVIAKVGAEGVHTVLIRDRRIGLAVKVGDGHARAQYPAVLRLLQHLDALPAELPPALQAILVTPVHDTRGDIVGHIRPAA
jgi:L-asparaginase II